MERWYPEIQHHCPGVPIVLCANKSDLVDALPVDAPRIQREQLSAVAKRIRAHTSLFYSAKSQQGLKEVFDTACRAVLFPKDKNQVVEPKWESVLLQPEGGSRVVSIEKLDDGKVLAAQASGRISALSVMTGKEVIETRGVPLNELVPEVSDFFFLSAQFLSFPMARNFPWSKVRVAAQGARARLPR